MDRVDKYIEKQKKIEPSPFLESRIFAKIESVDIGIKNQHKKTVLWQTMVVAASIVLMAALGITLGNSYRLPNTEQAGVMVNDSYIEQLSLYKDDVDE